MKNSLHISEILQKNRALSLGDASVLYSQVETSIENKKEIYLSFKDMEICSTIFLNHFLGELYSKYRDKVEDYLHYENLENEIIHNKLEDLRKRALKPDVYKPIFESHIS